MGTLKMRERQMQNCKMSLWHHNTGVKYVDWKMREKDDDYDRKYP